MAFPGESEEDFEATMQLVRDVNYASCYSFKYSARPGTPAANMPGLIHDAVASERLARLQALINEQQLAFNQSCVGKTLPVLFDRKGKKEGQLVGRSPYYQSVYVDLTESHFGEILPIYIEKGFDNSLTGTLQIAAA